MEENVFEIQKKAENGEAYYQHEMGVNYQYGYGVPMDKQKSLEWFLKAARTSGTGTCFAKIAKRLNSIRGTQRFTKPSQTDGKNKLLLNDSFMFSSYGPKYT